MIFEIEEKTFAAIPGALDVARKISVERVRDEFMKIIATEKPSVGIELLRISGLLDLMLPELSGTYDISQNRFHAYDIYHHSIYACDAAPADRPLIRLAALLHDLGKKDTRRIGDAGDYTFYVKAGNLIEDGKITKPIKDVNLIGNGPDSLSKVTMVANDMKMAEGGWTCGKGGQGVPVSMGLPTIKVSAITVGGVS